MQIDKSLSITLSFLRVFALISIVVCHILQSQDNKWAWVLNIGVQLFFFLSGYLYGYKEINNWTDWYVKRIRKIYLPFITTAVVCMTLYALFGNVTICFGNIVAYALNLQMFMGCVGGLQHLWFVTAIMLCYLMTPVLQTVKHVAGIVCVILLLYGLLEFYHVQYALEVFSALFIYSFGYLFANITIRIRIPIMVFLFMYTTYILYRLSWADILQYDSLPNKLFHTFVGITMSTSFILILWKVVKVKYHPYFVALLDKYSYEIYLTNHPLLLGPFSIMSLTKYFTLNVIIAIVLTFTLSYALKKMCCAFSESSLLCNNQQEKPS